MELRYNLNTLLKEDNWLNGEFYIEHDGHCFPCEGWTDAIYPGVLHWVEELKKIARRKDEFECEFPFMEGDYNLNITRKNGSKLYVRCLDGHDCRGIHSCFQEVFVFECDAYEFVSSLHRLYKDILFAVHNKSLKIEEGKHITFMYYEKILRDIVKEFK
ncbi:MAG: hypothetical protein E7655_04780 [Ruminococcaceae bacterium]|nr:hypothetical protein [Oscillospiraceae bacterium]